MSHPSLHLTAGDFDAYLPERATSNAYTRPRIELKQRAMAWGRAVVARLVAQGLPVELEGSDDHPSLRNGKRVDCQWIFFWRGQEAREELEQLLEHGRGIAEAIDDPSPHHRHALLALRLDSRAVEVCFVVHPDAKVDVANLRARLATATPGDVVEAGRRTGEAATLAAELAAALNRLPEQFSVAVAAPDGQPADVPAELVPASSASPEVVQALLERAADGAVPLTIGWRVSRELSLQHSESLGDQLEDALVALAPVYRLVAWSRDNDHISLDRQLRGVLEARARTHAEVEAANEQWRAARALESDRSREQARARTAERRLASDAARGPVRPSLSTLFAQPSGSAATRSRGGTASPPEDGDAADEAPELARAAQRRPLGASSRQSIKDAARPVALGGAPAVIDKGARVRVLAGPFAEKLGIVSELDGRGGARVLLGLLSTRLELGDLEAVELERDRPALMSSHRRPTAPGPRKAR